ncbi:uncharacterized protein A1O9_04475 [Exophiala aquamarina CBS 119918]|uniref:Uncharacterized protein n=1 Tax=Exophiala aquamarina CBS 119918 TaxID=1182545 RepID=A0A072PHL1_9EURO|nr:uncharacterized protein A1O9_04475 [Exophiala aquamarina CBS 119918]KEF59629.1 hypothetical protein A1O9_04475 [Exophiala aquamarina CBS 119918]
MAVPSVAGMVHNEVEFQSSSTGDSAYGYQISASPPSLSPSNTLPSLHPHTSNSNSNSTTSNTNIAPSPSKEQSRHHSFPFPFPFPYTRSRSKSPRPPPPTEICSPTSTTFNPLKPIQTQPNPSRKTPIHQHHNTSSSSSSTTSPQQQQQQRRHFSESSVPTLDTTAVTPASLSPLLPPSSVSPTSSPPTSPDTTRRDSRSWIQKKPRNNSGSLSPGGFGRHGDQWLFGGISFTETARGIVTRKASRSRK